MLLGLRSAVLPWPLGIFRGALIGRGDIGLANAIQGTSVALYAGAAVLLLPRGLGVVGVGWLSLAAFLVEHAAYVFFAFRRLPGLSVSPRLFDRRELAAAVSLGSAQTLVSLAGLLLLRTDPLIVGWRMPLEAVAAYAVALRVAEQAFMLVKQFVNALPPYIARLEGSGDRAALGRLLVLGVRTSLVPAVVVALPLAAFSTKLLTVWVGPSIATAGPALAVLGVATALMVFLEAMRILKPNGVFYLNAPTNGFFHRWPADSWRFYPDSGHALVGWAKRNGYDAMLLESFVGQRSDGSFSEGGMWNDFVAVFLKDRRYREKYSDRIVHSLVDFSTGYSSERPGILNHNEKGPDFSLIDELMKELEARALDMESLSKTVDERDAQIARLCETVAERDRQIARNKDETIHLESASLVSYTAPVIAVLLGVVLFDERLTFRLAAGSVAILAGVAWALLPERPARSA